MIGTIETRKVVSIELERSEVRNMLSGEVVRGVAQVKHKTDDIPVDIVITCNNPEVDSGKTE